MILHKYSYIEEKKKIVLYHKDRKIRIKVASELASELKEIFKYDIIEELYSSTNDQKIKEIFLNALKEIAKEEDKKGEGYYSSLYLPDKRKRVKNAKEFSSLCIRNHDFKTLERAYKMATGKVKKIFKEALSKKAERDAALFGYDEKKEIPSVFRQRIRRKPKKTLKNS